MEVKYRLFGSYALPLNEKDKKVVIESLTSLLEEDGFLTDGTTYDHVNIEKYFDLAGNALNQPDGSISLLTEVSGDIAGLLKYGMSEGMTHDRLISLVPGNFKVYQPPVAKKQQEESEVTEELKTNIENLINDALSDADIEAAASEGASSLRAVILQTVLLVVKETNAE